MSSKGDISKALARNLTGIEAARLILQDSVEVDHGRSGFLSDKDIQRIKSNLSSSEAEVYNRWIGAYRAIDYTLKEARITSQDIIIRIHKVIPIIRGYFEDYRQAQLRRFIPIIVTQKQYEDLKARQREEKLRILYSLYHVIDERVQEVYPEAWEAWENTEGISSGDYWIESYPEAWKAALKDLVRLIEAGKLKPVLLKPKEIEKLAELELRIEGPRTTWRGLLDKEDKGEEDAEEAAAAYKELDTLLEERDRLRRRMYEKGLASWSVEARAGLISRLREMQAGPLSEELERVLEYTYCSGQDLYNSGLPEHVRTIDTFWPGFSEGEESAELAGYAVIQDPTASSLDKRGYYKAEPLSTFSTMAWMEKSLAEDGSSLKAILQSMHRFIKAELRNILAMQSTLGTVSEVIGVDFTEDIKDWIEEVLEAVNMYNSLLQADKRTFGSSALPKDLKLPTLKVDDLKPSPQYSQYLKERLAMSLGQDWIQVWAEEVDKFTAQIIEEEGLEVLGRSGQGRHLVGIRRGDEGEGAESEQ